MLPEAVARYITEARCKAQLIDLVRIPSPVTDLLEAEPQLRAFIEAAVAPRLRAIGGAPRFDPMGNLIAELGTGESGRSLMLIGNAMNQPQATMANAYAGEVRDGAPYQLPGEVVLGKGASEQKAPLAAMLVALEALAGAHIGLRGRLYFCCCLSGESGRHDAIRSVIEAEGIKPDIAILGGQGLQLSLGNRGRIDVDVTVRGLAGHSSRPWQGASAISGAMAFLFALRQDLDLSNVHPQLGRPTLAVTGFQSFPKTTHTIQDRVELTLDRRLLPGEDPEAAFAAISEVAERVVRLERDPASGLAWTIEPRPGAFMYPYETTPDAPAASLVSDSMLAVMGSRPEVYFATNAFDQGYLAHVGISTVSFGPGEQRFAHTDLDMASVTRTRDAALIYADAIMRYLA